MNKLVTLASAMLLSFSVNAAQEVSGVSVPDNVSVEGASLNYQGAGVRSKFFIDLYVGSLFTQKADTDVVKSQDQSAIRLNIISGLITSEKMVSAINEGFDGATSGNTAPISAEIAEFIGVFSEEIVKGDQFTLVSIPGKGLTTYKNDEKLSTITNDDFRQAVLSIWLGDKPADDDLKEDMLGL
ncbi:chalcone isomerase family protein [Moritella sp. 24]|uniref:chalcone isomerase family protein n=1 Tax=Moritella sp. 24 TaxID=2746230 RepID=UPI001BAA3932|nr:chalcone isomerase family protein [Moritella sp. 24]QUM75379.1 chalcone isomerase family protein [Moritella sp. 24]